MADLLRNTKQQLVDIILRKDDEYAKLVKENNHLKDDLTFAKNNYDVLVKEKEAVCNARTEAVKQLKEIKSNFDERNNKYRTLLSSYDNLRKACDEDKSRHARLANKFAELEKEHNLTIDEVRRIKNKNKTTNIILIMVIIALVILNYLKC